MCETIYLPENNFTLAKTINPKTLIHQDGFHMLLYLAQSWLKVSSRIELYGW